MTGSRSLLAKMDDQRYREETVSGSNIEAGIQLESRGQCEAYASSRVQLTLTLRERGLQSLVEQAIYHGCRGRHRRELHRMIRIRPSARPQPHGRTLLAAHGGTGRSGAARFHRQY